MSKMSEEELEIKLEDIIEDLLEHYHEYHNDIDHVDDGSSNAHSKIVSLIHSYTKEKELEARMDENRKVVAMIESLPHGEPSPYFEERITELKAQLNKSKGE